MGLRSIFLSFFEYRRRDEVWMKIGVLEISVEQSRQPVLEVF
jgi:hypothetical protein